MFSPLHSEFHPPFALRNPHVQTIVGTYLRITDRPQATVRHEVELANGDRLVLHDDCPSEWQSGDRVVILMHGLAGSHQSTYMVRTAVKLNQAGIRTFRKDLRGHGAGFALANEFGHAGRSDDVGPALHFVNELCPESQITLVGFSLSGNIVLKYLAEHSRSTPACLDSVVTVSPPIDLMACGRNLRRGFNRFYDREFVKCLHQLAYHRHRSVPELGANPLVSMPPRLWEFDDQYTAPMSGFDGIEDYYARCSAGRLLKDVRVPTIILASADDPLVPSTIYERYPMSSAITLHMAQHGGHLGFVGQSGVDPDCRWMDWRIVDFVKHIGNTKNQD